MKDKRIEVLDKGFVELVDMMGGDLGVVEGARVSFLGSSKGPEKDRKLLNYLLKHHHTTPFEQAVFKFHVKCPVFVARQWFRHRIASYNEASQRYKQMPDEFYIPTKWRAQNDSNKQGSDETVELDHNMLTLQLIKDVDEAYKKYEWYLSKGVAKEMARFILPINIYTEFVVTLNAHALMHFIRLRSEEHAQAEIRVFSDAMAAHLAHEMPWTYCAFVKSLDMSKYENIPDWEK